MEIHSNQRKNTNYIGLQMDESTSILLNKYLALLPKKPYSFLLNYYDHLQVYHANTLQNLKELDIVLYNTGLRLFKMKAEMLAAFNIVQSKYKFTDEEFVELLRLDSIEELSHLKDGKLELVFKHRFHQGTYDDGYQFIINQAGDFMMLEYKKFNRLSSMIELITNDYIKTT